MFQHCARLRSFVFLTFALLAMQAATSSHAQTITFIPPNDMTGAVFSTNMNDIYNAGRGLVLHSNADKMIDSVGIMQDLTGITLNYSVAQIFTSTGQVTTGQNILRSGSAVENTAGLQFIDFAFAPLMLITGNDYHIEFKFNGNSNQNFFYNNNNVVWAQNLFTALDGTQGGNTANSVVPAIRLHQGPSSVPEPGSIALLAGTGMTGAFFALRRRRRSIK